MKASAQLFELQKFVGPNAKGPEKILQILKRGLALQQSGKLKEAEYCYQLVLRDNPDHPEALNLLGTLASKAKNHAIAIECLRKAVKAQPNNVHYRNNLVGAGQTLLGAQSPSRVASSRQHRIPAGSGRTGSIGRRDDV